MTTFSTFASRFLSSGLATSLRPAENAPAEQDPLFYSSASGFGLGAGGDHIGDHSLSSSDGLPPPNSYYPPGEPGQSRFGAQSLTGASRYGPSQSLLDAGPGAGGAGSKAMCRSIREIDDEEDVDLWRDERRMAGIGQGPGSQLGASSAGTASAGPSRLLPPKARQALPRSTEDSQDPFLGEHELDADAESEGNAAASQQGYSVEGSGGLSGTSTRSARRYEEDDVDDEQTDSLPPSRLYTAGSRTTSSGATKGKGWLAHRSTAPSSPPPRRSQRRLPADICRDPEMSTKSSSTIGDPDEDGDPYSIPDRPARSGPMDTLASLQASAVVPGRSRYSVYDDYDDEEGSGNIDTSRDGGAGSSLALPRRTTSPPPDLRHPLLNGSPSSSRSASPEPPGAFKGARRGRTVYVYPAPPAASGWGPWANRLALGKYRDKVAVVAYAAALSAVLVLGGAAAWSVRVSIARVQSLVCFIHLSNLRHVCFVLQTSAARPPSDSPTPSRPSSYYTITRSVPLLLLITLLSLGSGAANLLLLRHAARLSGGHILRAGLVGVPIVLGLGWAWAFAGSFMYDDEAWTGGGWSTVG